MATDFTYRMYWPNRGPEAAGQESRTTYGRTIALAAQLKKQSDMNRLSDIEKLANHSERLQTAQRSGSRMLSRRLPPLPQSAPDVKANYDDRYRYTMNRVRGIQSQVPMSRYMDPSSQQVSLRGTPRDAAQRHHQALEDYRLRQGRAGGTWKHVKEVLQSRGDNIRFIDGTPGIEEGFHREYGTARITSGLGPPPQQMRTPSSHQKRITLEEYKSTEGGNWNVMR